MQWQYKLTQHYSCKGPFSFLTRKVDDLIANRYRCLNFSIINRFAEKSSNNMRPARSTKKANPSASGGQKGTTAGASSQGRRDAGGAVVSKC